MIMERDRWKEPTSKAAYVSTGKEPAYGVGQNEMAYWILGGKLEGTFGDEPATVAEIYHQITGPLGLTSSETIALVRNAKSMGYLR